MWRTENLNCHGDNEADEALHQEESATEPTIPDGVVSDVVRTTSQDYRHGVEIGSFASKWKCQWKQNMHLIRLRKKTTVPKMYVWELPPSACVREEDASTVRVWLYKRGNAHVYRHQAAESFSRAMIAILKIQSGHSLREHISDGH